MKEKLENKIEQDIINKYIEGKSISKLLEEYPKLNRRKINKILRNNNIAIRGGRKRKEFCEIQIEEIKKMIEQGYFLKEIANYLKMDREIVKIRLDELGLKIKNHNRVNRNIKNDFFKTIDSPIKAYWIGFLYTDGCVDNKKSRGRIRLQLQKRDLEILEKFKEDLGLDSKIIEDKRGNGCYSVEFTSEEIFNDLAKFGIVPNKTYQTKELKYDGIPKNFLPSFVLGLYDGDGGLSFSDDFSKDVTISCTAYYEKETQDFEHLIRKISGLKTQKKPSFTSAWHVQWRGRLQCIKILDKLYENNPRFLKRKYDKYLALKNSLN